MAASLVWRGITWTLGASVAASVLVAGCLAGGVGPFQRLPTVNDNCSEATVTLARADFEITVSGVLCQGFMLNDGSLGCFDGTRASYGRVVRGDEDGLGGFGFLPGCRVYVW